MTSQFKGLECSHPQHNPPFCVPEKKQKNKLAFILPSFFSSALNRQSAEERSADDVIVFGDGTKEGEWSALKFNSAERAECKFEVAERLSPEPWLRNVQRMPEVKHADYCQRRSVPQLASKSSFVSKGAFHSVYRVSCKGPPPIMEIDLPSRGEANTHFTFILRKYKLYLFVFFPRQYYCAHVLKAGNGNTSSSSSSSSASLILNMFECCTAHLCWTLRPRCLARWSCHPWGPWRETRTMPPRCRRSQTGH